MLGATLVAALLRLHSLGEWSLWVDEAHTWRDATMPLRGEGGFLHETRALYPLTFLGLRALLEAGWLGSDEASLRLPFAWVGIVSVPVLGICGRRLVGPTAAVLAAWLAAIDPWHVYWSQNARGYGMAFLFAALAANRAARWSRTDRLRDLGAAVVMAGVGALCHPTALLLLLGLAVFVGVRNVPVLQRRTAVVLVVVLLATVWLLPELVSAFAPFQDFLRSKKDPSPLHFAQTTAYYYRPLLLLAAGIGLWLVRLAGERRRMLLLASLALVPFFVLTVLGGQLVKTTARYSICAFPVLLWLAGRACSELAARFGAGSAANRLAAALLPLLLAVDFGVDLSRYFTSGHGDRAQWREACEFVRDRAQRSGKGLWVLTVGEPIVWYYLAPDHFRSNVGDLDEKLQVQLLTEWRLSGEIQTPEQKPVRLHPPGGRNHLRWWTSRAAAAGAEFAVVVTLPELQEKDDGELWPTLQQEFDLVLHLPCFVGPKDESLYVFVPRNG